MEAVPSLPPQKDAAAGQAVYTKPVLSVYDLLVLGLSNRWIWKCPTPQIEAHYNHHLSANHLDVGVGTGYFLDRCQFPSPQPRVGLMDLNPNTLDYASQRIARYQPEIYRQNILEPITQPIPPFDSIGINYLLHCVPGSITEKAVAFDHLRTLMNPRACLFGSTILHQGVPRSWLAQRLMRIYNQKGIFSNQADDLDGLTHALKQRFQHVEVRVQGCVALFSGQNS
ncbi:methyltransferase [bacterium]|nr:methyltransferase [bacterium]